MPPSPPVHGRTIEMPIALELATSRFFLANPSEAEVPWDRVKHEVLAIAGSEEVPESFLKSVEGKVFSRPNAVPQSSSSPPDNHPTVEGNSDASLGVELVPSTRSTHRGTSVEFTASPIGLPPPVDFHFAVVPSSSEPGVDEVPIIEGDPSSSSTFSTSFSEVGKAQVMVRMYAPDGRTARTFAQVEISNRPPEITVENIPETVHRGQQISPLVRAEDPDGDSVAVSILSDDGSILAESMTPEFELESLGEKTVTVLATDSLGAVAEKTLAISVTNRPPSVTVDQKEIKTHPGQSVEMTPVTSDPDGDSTTTKAFAMNSELEQISPGVFKVAIQEPGRHEVRIETSDEHGATSSIMSLVEVENRPPEIALLPELPSTVRGVPVKLVAGVSDPDGDNLTITTTSSGSERIWGAGEEITASFSSLGPQEVVVTAVDSRGARVSEKIAVEVTNAPPSVELVISPESVSRGTEVKIRAEALDPESEGLLYKFEGPGIFSSASTSPEVIVSPTELGSVKVSVVVSDPHGALATASKSFEVLPRPPEISLSASSSEGSRIDDFSVQVTSRCPETGEPPRKIRILEPSSWKRTDKGFAGRFKSLGSQKIRVEVESTTGATSQAETSVVITNLPPTIEILAPNPPHQRVRPSRFDIKYADADGPPTPSSVEWAVDGGRVVSKDGTTAVVEYDRLGQISLSAIAVDSDGLSAKVSNNITIENVPPSIKASISSKPHYRTLPVEIKAEAVDIDGPGTPLKIEVTVDGQTLPEGDESYQLVPTRLGLHEVKVSVVDSEGSRSEETLDLEVENSPPSVELSSSPDSPTAGQEVAITARASDLEGGVLSYEFEANGVRFPPSSEGSTKFTFTKPGRHPVSVTVTDSDGAKTSDMSEVRIK